MVLDEKINMNIHPEEEEEEEEEDEEMVDPLEIVRNKCVEAENCLSTQGRLEECETRVGSRSSTQEDCTEELFDFLHARDHCVRMTFANFAGEECAIILPQGLAEAFFKIEAKVAHKLFHSVK